MRRLIMRTSLAAAITGTLSFGLVVPAANANPLTCGTVTYPESGKAGRVEVTDGNITCAAAEALVRRFLTDPSLVHEGNTAAAQFDGWLCASPTAVASQEYGYSTSCTRGNTRVVVRT